MHSFGLPGRTARLLALATVTLACLASGLPARAEKVGCDQVDLTFDTRGESTYCEAGNNSGRNGGSTGATGWGTYWQLIGLETAKRSIIMQHERANNRTYFEKLDVRSDVDVDPWFTESRNWGDVDRLGDYEVQRFEGTWKGVSGFWTCAGFSRYTRPIAAGGAGYIEKLSGAYCVPPGTTIAEDDLLGFLGSIRH